MCTDQLGSQFSNVSVKLPLAMIAPSWGGVIDEYFKAVALSTRQLRSVTIMSSVSAILLQSCPPTSVVEFVALAAVMVCVVKYSHIPFSILANAALGAVMPASVLLSELVEESAALTAVAANRDEPACMKAG